MSIATEYFNYQRAGHNHPLYAKGKQPGATTLMSYLQRRWTFSNWGIYVVRPVINGKVDSTHSFGTAGNAAYSPLPGRAVLLNEVLPFLIGNSAEIGIQMIADEGADRIWRADRSPFGNGWKPFNIKGGGPWIHFEIHPDRAKDARTIDEKLSITEFPVFDPAHGKFSLYPIAKNKPNLQLGSKGDAVRYLQGVLAKLGFKCAVDGDYGNLTVDYVRWYQGVRGLNIDGQTGPKTWAAIDKDAG